VLQTLVSEGSAVKEGQEIIILEAMKMETKVVAPAGGTLAKFFVKPGDKVESGDPLAAIE
jgi:pyruvate carboxylase subunit B